MPSDDIDADMKVILSHYREARGRHPERFKLPD
jgi:hypothetical protein